MRVKVMTLFPEMVVNGLNTSILGRAVEKGILELETVDIRDYTQDKHGKVDDYTYGGGAGMLMQAQPVYDAYLAAAAGAENSRQIRTIYVTPQGRTFDQHMAQEFAGEEELIFLCGHYEGVDERVLEEVVTDYVSIGDYVLTGGELAAMVMIDAIARLIPGVLNNDCSAETETFHNDLLEYPQYSRPEVWHGRRVPEILLSGNHQKISEWRLKQSIVRTRENRPDLYARYLRKQELIGRLSRKKRTYIHMIELLRRGGGEIVYAEGDNILLGVNGASLYMAATDGTLRGADLLAEHINGVEQVVADSEYLAGILMEKYGMKLNFSCRQACFTRREPLPVRHKDIRLLDAARYHGYVTEHYALADAEYIADRMRKKAMFGAFLEDRIVGFIGLHEEGGMGMLYVEDDYRGQGIGESLESWLINYLRERDMMPFCQIIEGNEASLRLQEKLGLYLSEDRIFWLG